jgi:hypothetical protein
MDFENHKGNLLFRYDNAVHKPALCFSDHKHTCDGTIHRVSSPDIAEVVDEIPLIFIAISSEIFTRGAS